MEKKHLSILIMASVRWYNASAHYALYLSECLIRKGHSVDLFGLPGSPVIKKAKELKIPVINEINLMEKNPLKLIKDIKKFKKIIKIKNYDIINPHISRDNSFAYFSNISGTIPVVRTRTDSIPPTNTFLNRYFYRRSANHFIVSSNFMAPFIKNTGIKYKDISTIPLEMDHKTFSDYKPVKDLKKKLNIAEDKTIVSFIGRLDNIKGIEYFLRSYPLLNNKENIHYIISGEETNLKIKYLNSLADELNINNISIIDRIDEVRELLSITDIGVIPSIGSEAICRIALEMLSFGIPIIGSRINSIPETISDYYGIIVNPADHEEIAEGINKLALNGKYISLKKDILSKLESKSPDTFVEMYLEIFHHCLKKK